MKFSIKDFFNKCDQIRRNLRILSHLLKKSFMENFIFCAVFLFHQVYIIQRFPFNNQDRCQVLYKRAYFISNQQGFVWTLIFQYQRMFFDQQPSLEQ